MAEIEVLGNVKGVCKAQFLGKVKPKKLSKPYAPRTFQQARGDPCIQPWLLHLSPRFFLIPLQRRLMGRLTARPAFPGEPLMACHTRPMGPLGNFRILMVFPILVNVSDNPL